MSRTPRRSCAGRAGNQEKPQTSAPGRPQPPSPAPAAKFPKTDTLPGRARGGAHGLPRRVPWRPRPRHPPPSPRKTGARKGAPKMPAHGACRVFPPDGTRPGRSVDAGTPTPTPSAPHPGAGGRGAHPAPRIHRVSHPADNFVNFRSTCHFPRVTRDRGPKASRPRRRPARRADHGAESPIPVRPVLPPQTRGQTAESKTNKTTTRGREKEEMPSDIKRKRSPLTAPRINYKKKKERKERKPKRNPDCQNMKHGRASSPATPARATGVPAPHRRPQPGLGRPSEARGLAVGTPGRQAGRQAREGPHECLWNRVVPLLGGAPARSAESGDPGGGAAGGGQRVVLT